MLYLKADTTNTIKMGPFVDSSDGLTPETGLNITQAIIRLSKNGGDFAQKNDADAAVHDEDGWYNVAINATDTDTEGRLKVAVDITGALPLWETFMVVNANVYDSLFAVAATDYLQVDVVNVDITEVILDISGAVTTLDTTEIILDMSGNINGNVSGSVGSVAGNVVGSVGSVDTTEWILDISGNLNGNVSGSVNSVATDVAGDIGGNVLGTVGGLDFTETILDISGAITTLDTTEIILDVSGSVTTLDTTEIILDISGNLDGNVTGTVTAAPTRVASGTINGVTSQTVFTIDTGDTANDDIYKNMLIVITDTSGAATAIEVARITAYTAATRTVTVDESISFALQAAADTYDIIYDAYAEAPGAGAGDWSADQKNEIIYRLGLTGTGKTPPDKTRGFGGGRYG